MDKPKKKPWRKKFSAIAEALYAAYRQGHEELPSWDEMTDDERQRWEDVADEAYELHRDRFVE